MLFTYIAKLTSVSFDVIASASLQWIPTEKSMLREETLHNHIFICIYIPLSYKQSLY